MSKEVFNKKITQSDAFLDMPLSTQALYFHLCEFSDCDGFVNAPKKIQKSIGASDDDYKLLIAKRFILTFESGVVVIKHWRMHNLVQLAEYQPTDYKEELAQLKIKENRAYTMSDEGQLAIEDKISPIAQVVAKWNSLESLGIRPITKIAEGSQRLESLKARLRQYSLEEMMKAIDNIAHSDFLQGKAGSRPFIITFDWFVRPNNFPKVLEGNYNTNKDENYTLPFVAETSEWQ